MYQKCLQNAIKNDTPLKATSNMKNYVSTAPARADRWSDPLENNKKTKKARPANHHAQEVVFYLKSDKKCYQKGILWDDFDGRGGPGA